MGKFAVATMQYIDKRTAVIPVLFFRACRATMVVAMLMPPFTEMTTAESAYLSLHSGGNKSETTIKQKQGERCRGHCDCGAKYESNFQQMKPAFPAGL